MTDKSKRVLIKLCNTVLHAASSILFLKTSIF
jgi:hypothetical protein